MPLPRGEKKLTVERRHRRFRSSYGEKEEAPFFNRQGSARAELRPDSFDYNTRTLPRGRNGKEIRAEGPGEGEPNRKKKQKREKKSEEKIKCSSKSQLSRFLAPETDFENVKSGRRESHGGDL